MTSRLLRVLERSEFLNDMAMARNCGANKPASGAGFEADAHRVSPEYHIVHRTGSQSARARAAALIFTPLWGSISPLRTVFGAGIKAQEDTS